MDDKNIMLVGLPRSGTTLTCHLINKIPDFVALHEPLKPIDFMHDSPAEMCERIMLFCEEQRKSLLENGTAASRTIGGKVPDNHIRGVNDETGKRANKIDGQVLEVDKNLSDEFKLVVKHNAFFAAILDKLAGSFKCFAVVRNPVSVLLSWNSVDMAVSQGYAPAAERFDKKLEQQLRGVDDKFERQIYLLTWYYNQIYQNLSSSNVVFYEDIISSSGRALSKLIPAASALDETLRSKNKNSLYDDDLRPLLAEKLLNLKSGGYLHYYSKDNVKEMQEI